MCPKTFFLVPITTHGNSVVFHFDPPTPYTLTVLAANLAALVHFYSQPTDHPLSTRNSTHASSSSKYCSSIAEWALIRSGPVVGATDSCRN
ncbi:hypothetical protein JTE90_006911 [Oedothorax gibbosus]|uniref:Uncharacterized protein n=1 Tax=Oedothorax gibbosus TaxID=931172 RepID=A0AAV6VNV1_9ARAC|nr:hypothetical protein JTE90_006911 [Oedothorax gibbosus]